MIDETLRQLIDFLKEACPVIWGAVYKQVYVEAVAYVVLFVLALAATYACYRIFLYGQEEAKRDKWSDWGAGSLLFATLGALAAIIATICINAAIGRFVNPEFYAIRYFISQLW